MILQEKSIFDTRFDTKKIFVSAKHRFSLRTYSDKDGNSLIYLDVSDSNKRIRLKTDIYIPKRCWNQKKQRIINHPNDQALNLVLENIEAKLTTIKTTYMLREEFLDAETLISEFQTKTPDFDFISFFKHHLEIKKAEYRKQTIKNHTTVLNKLEKFMPEIPFHKIDERFFSRYRKSQKENKDITYYSDLKTIKVYLRIAVKKGIKINIDLDNIKVNVHSYRITYLFPEEMKRLIRYYFNEFINPSHILPLGYFLISCYTGMRISDIQKRSREELLLGIFQFNHVKTNQTQSMKLNDDAMKVLLHCEKLFVVRLVDQKINFHLKKIAEVCKIDKNISMHVGRHTFATTVYRNTKDVFLTKKLLGHAKIEHTLVYVHLVEGEELNALDAIKY